MLFLLKVLSLPDKADVHAHGSVFARALVAQEHPDVAAAPLGVLRGTVKAYLVVQKISLY